jgi:acetylornithine/succinyldiaminopimelate/putrescine aminotransferase
MVNGLTSGQSEELRKVLASNEPKVLNRVLNLQTGSLAAEAAIKMMLTRFFRLDATFPERQYQGKIPVFLIVEDNDGGPQANYHGTTIFAQTLRGLWPELLRRFEECSFCKIAPVKINDIDDFRKKLEEYNQGPYKTAGFLHEIVLMNYGGILLKKEYLTKAYELCKQYDTPVTVDEIQSCMWYQGHCLFKRYGLQPDFVILGKGLSGGEYAASKVVTTAEMDTLNQFGALVTNGQEEIASLACLISLAFVEENGEVIESMGAKIEEKLRALGPLFPQLISQVEGKGHLSAIHFKDVAVAVKFVENLNKQGIDISAQTYKANCPPAALLKLPLVTTEKALNFLIAKMTQALSAISG